MKESHRRANKLIMPLSKLMSEFTSPFTEVKAKIGMGLFWSLALWFDELQLEFDYELASYITSLYDALRNLKLDGT